MANKREVMRTGGKNKILNENIRTGHTDIAVGLIFVFT